MKGFLKFLIGLVIFLAITVALPLGISYYYLVDKVDESPLDLYTNSVSLESELTTLFDSALNLDNKSSIDFTFTEDELNRLIYAMIKESKADFNPNSNVEEEKYIQVYPLADVISGISFLQNKKAIVKNVYAKIENDELFLYVPMEAMGIKTRAKLSVTFSETEDSFKINFKTLGLGKANLLSGLANKILNKVMDIGNFSDNQINQNFEEQGLPFTLDLANFAIVVSKDKLEMLVQQLINPEDMEESSEKDILTEFITTISSKENDLINFGIFNEAFGLQFDLTKFKVSEESIALEEQVTSFDQDAFIMNKVQSFVISNMGSNPSPKMVFSNNDFNAILYDQSNAYNDFNIEIPLPNSNSNFTIEIIGILVDFNANNVRFKINANLNGLNTSIVLVGEITQNNASTIKMQIVDSITIGEEASKAASEYISANASLIMSLLGDNISNLGLMQYEASTNSFIISAASFQQLMQVDGGGGSPLTVNKLKIIDNAVEVYCTIDPSDPFFAALNQATNALETALNNVDLDLDDFDTEDEEELIAVQAALAALDAATAALGEGSFDEEEASDLIAAINGLSQDNQDIFLSSLEDSAASQDLLDLYDSLFGLE